MALEMVASAQVVRAHKQVVGRTLTLSSRMGYAFSQLILDSNDLAPSEVCPGLRSSNSKGCFNFMTTLTSLQLSSLQQPGFYDFGTLAAKFVNDYTLSSKSSALVLQLAE